MAQVRHPEVADAATGVVRDRAVRPTRRWWLQVGALASLAAASRFALLAAVLGSGDVTLHVDEAQYWDWSREPAWGYYSKPPVIAALIGASTALFGDGVVGVKALAMLCWPAAALVLARLAFAIARHEGHGIAAAERAGVWAAVVFLVSTPAGVLGLAATTDAPLLLGWSLAALALWHASCVGGHRAWAMFGVAAALAMLSKYTAAALAVAAVAVAFVPAGGPRGPTRRRQRATGPLLAAAVVLAALAPHLAWNAAHGWPTLRHTVEITAAATPLAPGRAAVAFVSWLLGQAVLLGPVWGWWLWRHARRPARPASAGLRVYLAALVWPLLGLGAVQALHAGAEVNWTAPVLVGFTLWLALRLAESPEASPALASARRLAWAQALLVAAAMLIPALVLRAMPDAATLPKVLDAWSRMRGWGTAYGELRAPLRQALAEMPGAPVVTTSRALAAQGRHRWRDLALDWRAWRPLDDAGRPRPARDHYQLTRPWTPRPGQAVIVLSEGDPPPALRSQLVDWRPLGAADAVQAGVHRVPLRLWRASVPMEAAR